jgi:hypothetical protein
MKNRSFGVQSHIDVYYIAREPSPGIHAKNGTMVHTLAVIENHVHGYPKLFGKRGSPTPGVLEADIFPHNTIVPFTVTAAANSWGTEVQVFGTDDFDFATEKKYFSFTNMIITDTSLAGHLVFEFAHGTGTAAAAFADFNTTSTFTIILPTPISSANQVPVQLGRLAVGEKIWVRGFRVGSPGSSVDFIIGLHFYENGDN